MNTLFFGLFKKLKHHHHAYTWFSLDTDSQLLTSQNKFFDLLHKLKKAIHSSIMSHKVSARPCVVLRDGVLALLSMTVSEVAVIMIRETTQIVPLCSQPEHEGAGGEWQTQFLETDWENITFLELYLTPSPSTSHSFYLLPQPHTHIHRNTHTRAHSLPPLMGLTSLRLGLMSGLFWPFILWYSPQALHR